MASTKRKLSDTYLRSLKPATSKRIEVMDTYVPGFGVRLSESGRKTFILVARYPGSSNPTRRSLGEYPSLSLEKARKKAGEWRDLIRAGKDPKDEEADKRRAEQRKRADTFNGVAEDYIKRVLPKQRRGDIVAREIRREFSERWKGRPVTSIDRRDVIRVINETVDRGATYQAHNLFGHLRSLFNWAIEIGDYGLEISPCDRIRPKLLIGEREPRQRVLDDAEIKAFWKAADELGYPYGPLYQLLLLTGARKNEIGQARWSELDLEKKVLVVPAERFKSNAQHLVVLSETAVAIVEALPTFSEPDYLFSTTFGSRPVSGFAKAKEKVDCLMEAQLEAKLTPWRTHDLRRTVRTKLASLRVADAIAEMVIGHGKRGLQRVYDQHSYEPEMREALELWASRLRNIVEPPPENLIALPLKDRAR
ncbi:MAG: tyrosine-type recombinase/integrase [Pseudomonadota bacterium]